MKLERFYGQKCNHAFSPVYSEKGANSCRAYGSKFQENEKKEMVSFSFHEEFPSLDDCIQWALLQLLPVSKNKAVHVVVFDTDGNPAVSYTSTDALIRDIWKCMRNVPLTVDDKQMVDWFIFPKGTDRETVWSWFDRHYSKGIMSLISNNYGGK